MDLNLSMPSNKTTWLVRRKSGLLLGPYLQSELIHALNENQFLEEDEIAVSEGQWISATVLAGREEDEVTRTSTRSITVTQTKTKDSSPPKPLEIEDENPTVPFLPVASETTPSKITSFLSRPLVLLLIFVGFGFWSLFLIRSRPSSQSTPLTTNRPIFLPDSSPFVQKIYALIHAGKRQDALKELIQYHQTHWKQGEIEYKIPYAALLITEKESMTRAKKLLEEVLDSTATPQIKSEAHRWLGYMQLSIEEEDMGEGHFLEALQLNPKDVAARFNLGRAYLKQNQFKKALDFLQLAEAEIENPQLWLVHIYKGRAKAALGLMQEARVEFRTAVENAPDRWLTYIYFSLFLRAIEEKVSAIATLEKMLRRDPQYEIYAPAPLAFYQEKVNYKEYLDSFQEVMKDAPSRDVNFGVLYLNYLRKGPNTDEARELMQISPKSDLARKIVALKVALDRNEKNPALENFVKMLPWDLSKFGYFGFALRGEAYLRLGQLEKAQSDFQKALVIEPKTAVSRLGYAQVLRKTSRDSDAISEINSVLSYHPNYIPAILSHQN